MLVVNSTHLYGLFRIDEIIYLGTTSFSHLSFKIYIVADHLTIFSLNLHKDTAPFPGAFKINSLLGINGFPRPFKRPIMYSCCQARASIPRVSLMWYGYMNVISLNEAAFAIACNCWLTFPKYSSIPKYHARPPLFPKTNFAFRLGITRKFVSMHGL